MTHIDLSILLPSYNNVCVSLVQVLQRQADALRGKLDKPFRYEIIVADDCSTDAACIDANRVIGDMLHCRYLRMEQNVGRAQIRNVLISESRGDYVLLIDSDLFLCDDNYLYKYATSTADVVYGGTRIGGEGLVMVDNEANTENLKGNLRYIYEKKAEPSHRAVFRQLRPNQEISVCNLYARRDIMEAHGENGLISEKHNPVSLANCISKLLENKKLREKMGEAGYRKFKTEFTLRKFEERMAEILGNVITS